MESSLKEGKLRSEALLSHVSIPLEPHRVSQNAGPGLSLMQRLFCEISPGTVMIFLQDGAIQAEMLPTHSEQ